MTGVQTCALPICFPVTIGPEGGQNFSINPSKGVWCCYRCSSGGGWQELLAVKEGIITCAQAGKGCLTKKQRREVFQRAEELGLIKEQVVDAPIKEIELDREIVDEIPRAYHKLPSMF